MWSFALRRVLSAIPTVWVVITVCYLLLHATPGGPFDSDRKVSEAVLANLQAKYHLDLPLWQQYLLYFKGLLSGDLGASFRYADWSVNDLVAEALPVEDREADLISAGQCWHWFNGEAAANEFARVVRLGVRADRRQGRVLVAHFDWLPTPGSIVAATERLIVKHNPAWKGVGGDGIHTESLPPLWASGFRNFEMFGYDVDAAYTPEAWRGRVRASAGIGASLGSEALAAFDAELAAILAAHFPGDVLKVPHRVWALTGVLG